MAANHVNVSWSIMMFPLSHASHHNACHPCTGAHRRDFLLGIRCGQPAGAHVRFRCSRHRRSLAAPSELARPVDLSCIPARRLASGTGRSRVWPADGCRRSASGRRGVVADDARPEKSSTSVVVLRSRVIRFLEHRICDTRILRSSRNGYGPAFSKTRWESDYREKETGKAW